MPVLQQADRLRVMSDRLGSPAGRTPSVHGAGVLPLPSEAAGPDHSSDLLPELNRPSTGLLLFTWLRPAASVTYW